MDQYALSNLCSYISPQVVSITRPSRRRKAVVGVLKEEGVSTGGGGVLFLTPRDPRLPRAVVQVIFRV